MNKKILQYEGSLKEIKTWTTLRMPRLKCRNLQIGSYPCRWLWGLQVMHSELTSFRIRFTLQVRPRILVKYYPGSS